MKTWLDSLESRERILVIVGAVFVAFAIVYWLAWTPLNKKHELLKVDVKNWQQSLAELRPLINSTTGGTDSRPRAILGSQQSLIEIVDQTLRGRGLDRYRQRSQPAGNNGIRIQFENVAFDDLVLWLGDLGAQYALHVQVGEFSKSSQVGPGRVNASLTLERAL